LESINNDLAGYDAHLFNDPLLINQKSFYLSLKICFIRQIEFAMRIVYLVHLIYQKNNKNIDDDLQENKYNFKIKYNVLKNLFHVMVQHAHINIFT